VENKATYVAEEVRCRGKNHNEDFSKPGPDVCKVETFWNGPLGSSFNSEKLYDLDEAERVGQSRKEKATAHLEKSSNNAVTAIPINSFEVSEERRRKPPWTSKLAVQGAKVPTYQESTSEEEDKGGARINDVNLEGGRLTTLVTNGGGLPITNTTSF